MICRKHSLTSDLRSRIGGYEPAPGGKQVASHSLIAALGSEPDAPRALDGQRATDNRQRTPFRGFTLLELMIALSVVLILASFAIPAYYLAIQRAREAVLRQDLYTLRSLVDEFTVDKQRPPASLQELVEAGYLRGGVPVDPITGSSENWRVDIEDVPSGQGDAQPGVVDVHSGSDDAALDGTAYSAW
jgi:general secretion pathway protein G